MVDSVAYIELEKVEVLLFRNKKSKYLGLVGYLMVRLGST
jgi:hypothetical protein